MDSNVLISIIVPVYKAENYMRQCIDSILAQTFTKFELLLVDDGSPDKSGAICDEYAQKDLRVRVIHQQNGGVSAARQVGLEAAQGDYVIHADPDDWVEPTMLEELYKKATTCDADVVICDFYFEGKEQIYSKQEPTSLESAVVLKDLFTKGLHGSCWNKLVRRSLFCRYKVFFPKELSLYEDWFVSASLMLHDLKVAYCPKAFYHYRLNINENSISQIYSDSTYKYDLFAYNFFATHFSNTPIANEVRYALAGNMIARAYGQGTFSSKEFKDHFYKYRNLVMRYEFLPFRVRCQFYFSCVGFLWAFQSLQKLKRCLFK